MRNERIVSKAARLLDADCPTWPMHVSPAKLRMGHPKMCVLGQVYGDFADAPRPLLGARVFFGAFMALSPRKERRLVALWAQEITERRAKLLAGTGKAARVRVERELSWL